MMSATISSHPAGVRPAIKALLSVLICLGFLSFPAARAEEMEIIEIPVTLPFGITVGDADDTVPIYDQAIRGSIVDELPVSQICAVDRAEKIQLGKNNLRSDYWYHIYYLDDDGTEKAGTISGEYFNLFDIPDLMAAAEDPESLAMIQALLSLPEIAEVDSGDSTLNASINSQIGFSRGQAVEDSETSPIKFVLNTSSRKIHLPTCGSVEDMKLKNRKDIFYADEIANYIDNGYVPCKNFDPDLSEYGWEY